jgi:hypothetical protein
LLISEVRIGGDKDVKSFSLGRIEQRAVRKLRPTQLKGGQHLMADQVPPQRRWRTLVEQNAHSDRGHRTARGMFEDRANLFERDARKPLDDLGQRGALFEILEEGRDGHTSTSEHPRSAHALRMPLHSGTRRPVNHLLLSRSYTLRIKIRRTRWAHDVPDISEQY